MISNILLAVDVFHDTNKVFEYAIDLSNKYQSKLTILSVNEELVNKDEMIMSRVKIDKVMKSNEEIALNTKEKINSILLKLNFRDSDKIKIILREGSASQEIVQYAEEINADFIILGSSNQSKITELLMGSTSKTVIKKSKIPVLVVPLVD